MRRTLHITSVALITAGVVVLADAVATLLWEEPVSAAYGAIQQSRAGDSLAELEEEFPTAEDLAALEGAGDQVSRARVLARRFAREIEIGDAIGRLEIERIGADLVLMHGTDTGTLQQGPGHYESTALPGLGETAGVAGHRTTYGAPFRDIDQIRDGDEITVRLPYATFTYEVEKHEIVKPEDVEIVDPAGYERLVLTACHPLYSAAERWAVFARMVRVDTFAVSGEGAWPPL